MILYIDSENRIKDVNTTSDNTLIPLEVDDSENPFIGWSVAKICCYKVYTSKVRITPYPEPVIEEIDGEEVEVIPDDVPEEEIEYKTVISGYTPYVDSRLLEHIDQLGKQVETVTPYKATKTAYIGDTEITFFTEVTGNLTIYFPYEYTVERLTDRIIITFEPLEEVTDITISIL